MGAIDGFRGPSVLASGLPEVEDFDHIPDGFLSTLSSLLDLSSNDFAGLFELHGQKLPYFHFVAKLYQYLLSSATLAVVDQAKPKARDGNILTLRLPTTRRAIPATVDYLRWTLKFLENDSDSGRLEHLNRLKPIFNKLCNSAPEGSNCYRLLQAAHELSIPTDDFLPVVQIYGQGCRSIWMNSSLTPYVGVTSVNIARNKHFTNYLLHSLGFPVAKQGVAKTLNQAKQLAQKLGYPVVLKPKSLDGGIGVTPDIRRELGLERAFKEVAKFSKEMIVEKHFEGRDYRITVFQGSALGAVERVPGSVVGDGSKTIKQLIDVENLDSRRGQAKHFPLKPLRVDDEMQLVLAKQNLKLESVPGPEQWVRLRKTANINSGGIPINATKNMHPENAALAVRAAQALRLDLAGVDLLIPDIARSWRDSGAVICEVNAQPTIGSVISSHLYPIIMRRLIPGTGRIPIMVALGRDALVERAELAELLKGKGLTLGFASNSTVEVAGNVVEDHFPDSAASLFDRATAVIRNPIVGVALIQLEEAKDLESGLPFDKIDILLRGDSAKKAPASSHWASLEKQLAAYSSDKLLNSDNDVPTLVQKLQLLDQAYSQSLE